MLGLCWVCIGFVLGLCWVCVGFVLGLCYLNFNSKFGFVFKLTFVELVLGFSGGTTTPRSQLRLVESFPTVPLKAKS